MAAWGDAGGTSRSRGSTTGLSTRSSYSVAEFMAKSTSSWWGKIHVASPRRTFAHMPSVFDASLPRNLKSRHMRRSSRQSVVLSALHSSSPSAGSGLMKTLNVRSRGTLPTNSGFSAWMPSMMSTDPAGSATAAWTPSR